MPGPWFREWRSALRLATAVRPEEVYVALQLLAKPMEGVQMAEQALTDARQALATATSLYQKAPDGPEKAPLEASRQQAARQVADAEKALADANAKWREEEDGILSTAGNAVTIAENDAAARPGKETGLALAKARAALKKIQSDLALREPAKQILFTLWQTAEIKTAALKAKLEEVKRLEGGIQEPVTTAMLTALSESGGKFLAEIDKSKAVFESWFNTAQNRAKQWFMLHVRGITAAVGIVFSLLFQWDAGEIFHFISTDGTARAALVAMAPGVEKKAGEVLGHMESTLADRIVTAWNNADKDRQLPVGESYPDVASILAQLNKLYPDPGNEVRLKAVEESTVQEFLKDQGLLFADLQQQISETGFELVPPDFWRWLPDRGIPATTPQSKAVSGSRSTAEVPLGEKLALFYPHLPGMLFFAALLSLGAPFWYNQLKNLSSLKPALAKLIGSEEEAAVNDAAKSAKG